LQALTIRQPCSSLKLLGIKGIENRSWPGPAVLTLY